MINRFGSKFEKISSIFLHSPRYTIGGGMGIPSNNWGVEWVYTEKYLKLNFKICYCCHTWNC